LAQRQLSPKQPTNIFHSFQLFMPADSISFVFISHFIVRLFTFCHHVDDSISPRGAEIAAWDWVWVWALAKTASGFDFFSLMDDIGCNDMILTWLRCGDTDRAARVEAGGFP
jgi:hypothetical protein